jgi:hypothetical protein
VYPFSLIYIHRPSRKRSHYFTSEGELLVRDPPHQLLATDCPVSEELARIFGPLEQRLALDNPQLIRLDDALLKQSRYNLSLEMVLEELVLFNSR